MQQSRNDKTLGSLVSELTRELLYLIRHEITLAKVEMSLKAGKAARYTCLIVAGGAFAFAALLLLLTGVVTALTDYLSPLVAAVVVSLVVGSLGVILMGIGFYRFRKEDFTPNGTAELIREEEEWHKDRVA